MRNKHNGNLGEITVNRGVRRVGRRLQIADARHPLPPETRRDATSEHGWRCVFTHTTCFYLSAQRETWNMKHWSRPCRTYGARNTSFILKRSFLIFILNLGQIKTFSYQLGGAWTRERRHNDKRKLKSRLHENLIQIEKNIFFILSLNTRLFVSKPVNVFTG